MGKDNHNIGITFTGEIKINGPMFDIHDNQHVHITHVGKERNDVERPSAAAAVEETECSEGSADQRIRTCVDKLLEEKVIVHLYDYTWVMEVMNQTDGLPHFNTPQSFINYMNDLGIEKMPSDSTINKKQNVFSGSFADWKFTDCVSTEANRRINVAKRFLNIYRKLTS